MDSHKRYAQGVRVGTALSENLLNRIFNPALHPRDRRGEFRDTPGNVMLSDAQLRSLPFAQLDRERHRAAAAKAAERARRVKPTGRADPGIDMVSERQKNLEFTTSDYYDRVHGEWQARVVAGNPEARKFLRKQVKAEARAQALKVPERGGAFADQPLSRQAAQTVVHPLKATKALFLAQEGALQAESLANDDPGEVQWRPAPLDLTDPDVLSGLTITELARAIAEYIGPIPFSLRSDLDAMESMHAGTQIVAGDAGKAIVSRFLRNASSWTGPVAEAIKADLRRRTNL